MSRALLLPALFACNGGDADDTGPLDTGTEAAPDGALSCFPDAGGPGTDPPRPAPSPPPSPARFAGAAATGRPT